MDGMRRFIVIRARSSAVVEAVRPLLLLLVLLGNIFYTAEKRVLEI